MKLGIISDIHEDFSNLQKALSLLERKGCDRLVCLGDVAGYAEPFFDYYPNRSASKCWDMVFQSCSYVIPGNHDLFAIRKIPQSNPGFDYPAEWYKLPLDQRISLSEKKIWLYEPEELPTDLPAISKSKISGLPEHLIINPFRQNILLSHYLYPDLSGSGTGFLPNRELASSHARFMEEKEAGLSLFGHCHPQGLLVLQRQTFQTLSFNRNYSFQAGDAIGVPCIADGRNIPGVAVADLKNNTIKAYPLRNLIKRILT